MSYESEAVIFYGFPLAENTKAYRALIDSVDINSRVKVDTYGDCHGHEGLYVYLVSTRENVDLGGIKAINNGVFCTPAPWDTMLREFATAHDVPWPADWPQWHLTARRA